MSEEDTSRIGQHLREARMEVESLGEGILVELDPKVTSKGYRACLCYWGRNWIEGLD